MLKYYGKNPTSHNGTAEPLFRIPVGQIRDADWVEALDEQSQGQTCMLGKVDLINRIEKEQKKTNHCFEVHLKAEYESLHLLNSVNGSLVKQVRQQQNP